MVSCKCASLGGMWSDRFMDFMDLRGHVSAGVCVCAHVEMLATACLHVSVVSMFCVDVNCVWGCVMCMFAELRMNISFVWQTLRGVSSWSGPERSARSA